MKSVAIALLTFLLRIGLAAVFLFAAFSKFNGWGASVDLFRQLDMEPVGRYLVATLEGVSALLILFPLTVPTGALLGWGLMTGALLAHFTKVGVAGPMLPLALTALAAWIASMLLLFLRRDQVGFIRHMFDCGKKEEDSPNREP
ncbi:MAG: DoxX-like family protein [Verrucomicrobia bacterium]|jgi:uncharacterized membrane protein YphA (DoxX/SURF4 family)|nr:DoxX-like family protein [Verrucomicrobiota bacterium]